MSISTFVLIIIGTCIGNIVGEKLITSIAHIKDIRTRDKEDEAE